MTEDQLTNQDPTSGEQIPPHAMFRDLGDQSDAADIGRPKKSRHVTTQVTVALVLVVGGGSIYWMRQTGMKSGMDFNSEPIAFESQYTPADHERFQKVLRDLEKSDARVQIAAADSGSNPFFIGIVHEDTGAAEAEARAERERERLRDEQLRTDADRQKKIVDKAASLRLGTILFSSNPKVSIDSRIYSIGDKIAEFFTIVDIQATAVILEADGVQYTITPQTHGPGTRR